MSPSTESADLESEQLQAIQRCSAATTIHQSPNVVEKLEQSNLERLGLKSQMIRGGRKSFVSCRNYYTQTHAHAHNHSQSQQRRTADVDLPIDIVHAKPERQRENQNR